jgi:hypothetical protein
MSCPSWPRGSASGSRRPTGDRSTAACQCADGNALDVEAADRLFGEWAIRSPACGERTTGAGGDTHAGRIVESDAARGTTDRSVALGNTDTDWFLIH